MTKKQFPEGFFTKDRPIAKPKYLNAEEMLNNYEADCEVYENNGDSLDAELWMVYYLKNHSSADVQPIVHAHLVPIRPEYEDHRTIGIGLVYCDNCGNTFAPAHERIKSIRYCPCCGARLDGDEHD